MKLIFNIKLFIILIAHFYGVFVGKVISRTNFFFIQECSRLHPFHPMASTEVTEVVEVAGNDEDEENAVHELSGN